MRRFCGLRTSASAWFARDSGNALRLAERSIAQRRMLLPIHIQDAQHASSTGEAAAESHLVDAKLLVKWTSATKKIVHLIPLIASPSDPATTTSISQNADNAIKAMQTFRRIALNTYDVASIICALDNKLPEVIFNRRNLTMHLVKDADGTLNVSGTVYPFVPGREAVEAEKRLYAAVLDRPTTVLLKNHLESILTEMFGIEHYYHVIRPNNIRRIAYQQSARAAPRQRSRDGQFASALDAKVERQHVEEVAEKEQADDETLGDLLNDGMHQDVSGKAIEENVTPVPAATSIPPESAEPSQHLGKEAANQAPAVEDINATPVKSKSKAVAAKGKKKEPKRKKKTSDADAQSLFDI